VIKYRPGKDNIKADALTRRNNETVGQNLVKKALRQQQLLKDDQLDPQIRQMLSIRPGEESLALAVISDTTLIIN